MKVTSPMDVINYLFQYQEGLTAQQLAILTDEKVEDIIKILNILESSMFYFPFVDGSYLEDELSASIDEESIEIEEERLLLQNQLYKVSSSNISEFPQLNLSLSQHGALLDMLQRVFLKGDEQKLADSVEKKLLSIIDKAPSPNLYKGLSLSKVEERSQKVKAIIEDALLKEKQLSISYSDKGKEVNWTVSPLGLILNRETGFWYLLAQNDNAKNLEASNKHTYDGNKQLFRIDRIIDIRPEKPFIYPSDFSLHQFMKPFWGLELNAGEWVKVRFLNEAQVIRKALKELSYRYPKEHLENFSDGSLLFTGQVVGLDSFRSWLRGFGSSVEVLEPAHLRESMIESAKMLYLIYSEERETK